MTKSEKKSELRALIHLLDSTNDPEKYLEIRKRIYNEIIQLPYRDQSVLDAATVTAITFLGDLDSNFMAIIEDKPVPLSPSVLHQSKNGLITIVEMSLLSN